MNVMFLVAAVIWLFLLPTALRDIWRRSTVRVEDTMPSLGQADPPVPGTGIAERQAPVRW